MAKKNKIEETASASTTTSDLDTGGAGEAVETLTGAGVRGLVARLRDSGTGKNKLTLIGDAASVEEAIERLEKSGWKVTAEKARKLVG